MYKVVLVDDEPTIREGLRTLIEWSEYGFEVADAAGNGKDAMAKCAALKPDLLIADIRMPEMNGLELVRALRERGDTMRVLILSGYADFEYAKQAIAQRIDGYLLKPVDEDELISYLSKLKVELDEEHAGNKKADRQWEADVAAALAGNGEAAWENLWESLKAEHSAYAAVLLKPLRRGGIDSEDFLRIKNALADTFEERKKGYVFAAEPYLGVLVKGGAGDEGRRQTVYRALAEACAGFVPDFAAAAGGTARDARELAASYREAQELMRSRFYSEGGHLLTSLPAKPASPAGAPSDAEELAERLFLCMEVGNREAAAKLEEEAGAAWRAADIGEDELKRRFVQALTAVLDKLAHAFPESKLGEHLADALDCYREPRYADLLARAARIAEGIVDSLDLNAGDKQIKKMKDLIHRNYKENLKLEKLAELLNYNSAYLGKLFKQATGESFNTYLDKVRIEQAKALLEQGVKVYQAAESVGYANVDYFHAKFRKYVGCSPSVYKKQGT